MNRLAKDALLAFATAMPIGIALAIAVVVASAGNSCEARVLIEAHRGDSINAPENTLASITSAIGKADLVEFDVRATADGKLVLMHDRTVNRTTNGTGTLADLSYAQVQTFDAGSWFSTSFSGEPVPTMAQAIETSLAAGITPLIERKAGSALAYHQEFVALELSPEDFRVISFDWSFLADLNALDSNYDLGALGSGALNQSVINTLQNSGVDFVDWSHSGINQATVNLVQANGMELHTWTVNSPARMQQLIDYGVDGITTDNPAVLRQLVLLASQTADLNGDNQIDAQDWLAFNANRGTEMLGLTLEQALQAGDLDGDFDSDIADFILFKSLYLEAQAQQSGAAGFGSLLTAVPEPSNWISMMGLATLYAGCSTRQKTMPTV